MSINVRLGKHIQYSDKILYVCIFFFGKYTDIHLWYKHIILYNIYVYICYNENEYLLLNGHEFEQALGVDDGQGSMACCSSWGLQGVGHD